MRDSAGQGDTAAGFDLAASLHQPAPDKVIFALLCQIGIGGTENGVDLFGAFRFEFLGRIARVHDFRQAVIAYSADVKVI